MPLISHTFLPRANFDMDTWFRPSNRTFGPSTLDMFDPFDDLDRTMSRNLMWLDKPSLMDMSKLKLSRMPQKYRISIDCTGYSASSIKTQIKDGLLIVSGSESTKKNEGEDYSAKEFQKSFKLPENYVAEKMASFMTSSGQLVVEIPLQSKEEEHTKQTTTTSSSSSSMTSTSNSACASSNESQMAVPHVVDGENGQKSVAVKMGLPANVDASKISITCKDRDLIVQAEEIDEKGDKFSQKFYYQRITLPENTDFKALKCMYENNKLSITAPLLQAINDSKPVQIEVKNS